MTHSNRSCASGFLAWLRPVLLALSLGSPVGMPTAAEATRDGAPRSGQQVIRIEIVPLTVQDGDIRCLRPRDQQSWRVDFEQNLHPHATVNKTLAARRLKASVVHSTSWRYVHGGIILTYVAALDGTAVPEGFVYCKPVGRRVALGGATTPPASISREAVVNHAVRHLAWLSVRDPAIRKTLAPRWQEALRHYR